MLSSQSTAQEPCRVDQQGGKVMPFARVARSECASAVFLSEENGALFTTSTTITYPPASVLRSTVASELSAAQLRAKVDASVLYSASCAVEGALSQLTWHVGCGNF